MRQALLILSLAALPACDGTISGLLGSRADELNPCTSTVTVGSAPMRRLSHDEYRHSLTDVFDQPALEAAVSAQAKALLADSQSLGFRNGAAFLDVKLVLAQQYMDAAEALSTAATSDLGKLLPCTESGDGLACATQFIEAFGKRLYRRPLTAAEVQAYQKVYGDARASSSDFKTGIQWLVFTFLQSPGFLYRVELDVAGGPGVRPVTPLELASRLSFLFWQSVPDAALLEAAEGGQLSDKADVEREARRLLADPRSQRVFGFFEQWLALGRLSGMSRDPTAFPNLDPKLPELLMGETEAFVKGVVFEGDGRLETLLTAPYTFLNQPLAKHYGYSGITGEAFQKFTYPGRRAGLLMLGGVMASNDVATRTSIIRRGAGIRTRIMCQIIPTPPSVVPALGPIDANLSQADRLAIHRTDPNCAVCHLRIDSLGSPFEAIDPVGRDRTLDEAGRAVQTAGELTGSVDQELNGVVSDGLEMVGKLAQSAEVSSCFTTQLYRFSQGRKEEDSDACSRYQLTERFRSTSGDIRELLVAMSQMDDFLYRRATPP
jgi:hypothetical protein